MGGPCLTLTWLGCLAISETSRKIVAVRPRGRFISNLLLVVLPLHLHIFSHTSHIQQIHTVHPDTSYPSLYPPLLDLKCLSPTAPQPYSPCLHETRATSLHAQVHHQTDLYLRSQSKGRRLIPNPILSSEAGNTYPQFSGHYSMIYPHRLARQLP